MCHAFHTHKTITTRRHTRLPLVAALWTQLAAVKPHHVTFLEAALD
jgi:hypothetical protein